MRKPSHLFGLLLSACLFFSPAVLGAQVDHVQIHDDQLWVDGQAQPQLFGAEIQYFRLRGGAGPNVPREQVIAAWNRALDHVVEAGMNAVSFYIPWDFHEYAEGKFDFTGTVDEDGDGKPDYPSRDVMTFIRLIKEHGIKHILVRPGPYINAEWGFLGFGAVPLWFHEKYPNSHARNAKGQRTTLYSYDNPDFLSHSRTWLETVYHQVLQPQMGPGSPISFLQIDNETNFMWQSIYNHDYSSLAVQHYQDFLQARYQTLAKLNLQHDRQWATWAAIKPPVQFGLNLAEDQDWYRFHDYSLFVYLKEIRKVWTDLGVSSSDVIFTLAESYNATQNGLLPNYKYRNSPQTAMMSVNLYPKTYETSDVTLMNLPFKADHDVKAADAASDAYLGQREAWVLGPEIQGGWWKGTTVSPQSRQQTYLTTIGHGLKALFIYYFNEGYNWQYDWMKTSITPYFITLKSDPRYQGLAEASLPQAFWTELDAKVADQFMVVDTHGVWTNGGTQPPTLYFDAALDGSGNARAPFQLVKDIGQKIIGPYGDFLGKAHELEDPVCVIKDTEAQVPSAVPGVDSVSVQSDLNGALLGWLMQAGVNARIHHWNLNPTSDLLDPKLCKLVIYQDAGFATPDLVDTLSQVIDRGGSVVSFIAPNLANEIQAERGGGSCSAIPSAPMQVNGYRCGIGIGSLYYAQVPIYDVFNRDYYSQLPDAVARRGVLDRILTETGITPHLKFNGGGDRTVVFGRTSAKGDQVWVTTKTGRHDGFTGRIQWTDADPTLAYQVTDVLGGTTVAISGADLAAQGFSTVLGDSDSKAYFVTPVATPKVAR